jgi:hypothetical protein
MEESKEAFQARMEALAKDHEARLQKSWEEVQGTEWAQVYCLSKAGIAAKNNDKESADVWIAHLLETAPTEGKSYFLAAMVHRELGEESEAMAKLGVAILLDPTYYVAHSAMAKLLFARGATDVAQILLEQGWKQKVKLERVFLTRPSKEERQRFFTLP